MIFAIQLSPCCQGIFDKQSLTNRDITSQLEQHAKMHTDKVCRFTFMYPDRCDKSDPLGHRGILVWTDDNTKDKKSNDDFTEWVRFCNFPFPSQLYVQAMIYSNPFELRETFNAKALGLQGLFVDKNSVNIADSLKYYNYLSGYCQDTRV